MLNESTLREFYEHVYPVELITQWLSYNFIYNNNNIVEEHSFKSIPRQNKSHDNNDTHKLCSTDVDTNKENFTSSEVIKSEQNVLQELGLTEDASQNGQRENLSIVPTQTLSNKLHSAASNYLSRREFCFTLLGDIFTRFLSYCSAVELRAELMRCTPEKIDVGAVYNIRPNQKQSIGNVLTLERELVFDIDMSDYDNVRSCCSGKAICNQCWAWMTCAARVLQCILTEDFGFKYILPVFSGRRGIHLWVCDRLARKLHDDERAALVGYLTVITSKQMKSSVISDLAYHRPIHPSIRKVLNRYLDNAFTDIFLKSSPDNANNVLYHAEPAAIVYNAIVQVLKQGRRETLNRFIQQVPFIEGSVLDWSVVCAALGQEKDAIDVLYAAQLLLLYPRLDEHVSTRRDHLLKLPFCVHPATGALCCPLTWSKLHSFNPSTDAPLLSEILLERHIDEKWIRPLQDLLQNMSEDEGEREQ